MILAGPIAQRGARAPLEVFGETSGAVDAVEVRYRHGGRRFTGPAELLRAADPAALERAGIPEPFGMFVAELPARARHVVAVARDERYRRIGRDDYRDFHDLDRSVLIAGPARPLPEARVRPVIGRLETVRVPVRIGRQLGLRDGIRRSYFVTTDSPQAQAGCVTQREDSITHGRIGTTRRASLDEADGEGGGLGWCPGPYLGRVVYSTARACPGRGVCEGASPVPRGARLVARFSYRVR